MELDRGLTLARWGTRMLPRVFAPRRVETPKCCAECGREFASGERSAWILTDRVHEECHPFREPKKSRAA